MQKTKIDAIEPQPNGVIQLRLKKGKRYHRTIFSPGDDIDLQMRIVNHDLETNYGFAGVSDSDIAKIKVVATKIWNPEMVKARKDKMQAEWGALEAKLEEAEIENSKRMADMKKTRDAELKQLVSGEIEKANRKKNK